MEIFSSLGFNNLLELSVETFPAGMYNITLHSKFGGDNEDFIDPNELSFYHINTSIFNVLFTPSEPAIFGYVIPPLTRIFSADYQFGLSLLSWRDTRYFTEHVLNPEYVKYPEYPGESYHTKVYLNLDDPSMLLVGFDERSFCTTFGDHDYNDMVFSLQQQYYLDVVSAFDTPSGQGWYNNGTDAFASLATSLVDHGNGTRAFFNGWSNDASGNDYALSDPIRMNQNKTAVAAWKTQHYLTVKTEPPDIAIIPGEDWYDHGTAKLLEAPAVAGYTFSHWELDSESQGSGVDTIAFALDRPYTAIANYLYIYTLKIETGPGGSTNPPIGTYSADEGATIQVTANPNAFYMFDRWLLDGADAGSANPYTVLIDGNHTLKALFKPLPPPTVTISPMAATIWLGQSVDFTSTVSGQTPPYTYQWYMDNNPVAGATSDSSKFTPSETGMHSVYLKVTDINGNTAQSGTAQITVRLPLSVSISPLDSSILPGQTVKFTSTPVGGAPPYSYQWYLGGKPVAGATSINWTFQPMTSGIFYVYLGVTDAEGNEAQSGISRVEVRSIPVGGYSVSPEKHANQRPLAISFAVTVALATFLVAAKRRTNRRKS